MESQPKIPEFRNNPENFHPCDMVLPVLLGSLGVYLIFLLSIHSLYL